MNELAFHIYQVGGCILPGGENREATGRQCRIVECDSTLAASSLTVLGTGSCLFIVNQAITELRTRVLR